MHILALDAVAPVVPLVMRNVNAGSGYSDNFCHFISFTFFVAIYFNMLRFL